MEEKKLDLNSIIGFVLIFGILIYMFYINQPTPEELAAQKAEAVLEEVAEEAAAAIPQLPLIAPASPDDLGVPAVDSLPKTPVVLENKLLHLEVSPMGGMVTLAKIKSFKTYDSVPVYLVKDQNAQFSIGLPAKNNSVIQTASLYFLPELTQDAQGNQHLKMTASLGEGASITYHYQIKPDDYLLDFWLETSGLDLVVNTAQPAELSWVQQGIRHSKSVVYENRYTRLTYRHEGDKISKLSDSSDDEEQAEKLHWASYRQHFFSSILAFEVPVDQASMSSVNLVKEEDKSVAFTKTNTLKVPLNFQSGALNTRMFWFYGPTDVAVLSQYKALDLESSIPFGWGIFGWLNRYVFTPMYTFLSEYFPHGIAIIVMTVLVRLVMSPVTYKSYVSQAKMKVLKPEITAINEQNKENAMKRQQETMKLYSKAGVSPTSGCVPALLQLPIFYALFMFFPTSFVLRQQSFLWADDLSSYDTIAQLPFSIPFYGDHVSLFPILASIAIFIYMMMTTGQNMPTQPGMPNMKFIIYLSPVMMLFFFNSYASGLSLYYFVSNLITILIMLVIKHLILDDKKIHAQIEFNKQQPKKESGFQRKMRELMEQAETQKKLKK
ncbi:MAG: membrane protein insertase YidC [Flavobacteriaceae bacterium]|jgi:YidC/Oxa1 family membrane protein insertase|nr:membrane protein insertase YidC [Flavobacteriaceae bacterium]MDP4673889.1 membrane protein insertase YidC [Flavobacteriaceae bacterium]MDP4754675.1 membrane protein insertase YidC [Flavobacteriaceae bacterium]MDP4794580.1 membrane protein insertase YidC [Flavobacteriaceae bacterium]MDP4885416.1 membrane protein insertase YidC [Flavobacteriaceae bacterium]